MSSMGSAVQRLSRRGAIALVLLFTAGLAVAGARLLPAHAETVVVPGNGYWMVASDGGIFSFGDAEFHGSRGGQPLNKPIVGMAATPTGRGYWFVASDGGIFSYGDAPFLGSMGGKHLNSPIVGMAATPSGNGYWLVAADGGIFTFGDAQFFGSMGGKYLFRPIVGMASTNSGNGYWFVASDGGIFSFGDAVFHGSTGGRHLNEPIVGMAADPFGTGYWFVAADGGVFAFGASFLGSTGGEDIPAPIMGMSADPAGNGYWLVGSDGEVYEFGDAPFFGSMGGEYLNQPIVGMAPTTFLDGVPVVKDDTYTTATNTPLTVAAPGVLANDSDPDGDQLGAMVWDEPANGTLVLNEETGAFTYQPNSGFSGTDSFTYLGHDYIVGNIATVTVNVTNTAPTMAVTSGPASGATTNDTTPTFGGTSSDSDGTVSALQVSTDAGPFNSFCTTGCATWSYTHPTALSPGLHTLRFRAVDNHGTASALVTRVVTVDTTAPTVTINQKSGQADPTNVSPAEFTVTFSEAVTGFDHTDLTFAAGSGNTATRGTPVVTGSGTTYNVAIPLTADGTVTPTVPAAVAKDVAGNDNAASTSTDNSVTYDATRPTFDSIAATAGSPTVTATFSESLLCSTVGTGDFEATVGESPKAVIAAACTAPADSTVELTLSEAPGTDTTVAVRALGTLTDAAGNTVADTTKTVDTNDAPGLAVTGGPAENSSTNDQTPTYSGTATDGDGTVKQVEASIDNGAFTTSGVTCTDCNTASATWSWTPATLLLDGPHTVAFRAVDNQAGTSAVTTRNVLVDIGAPGVTVAKKTGQADPTNSSPIRFTVTFSEPVTGFTASDVNASGAGAGTPTVTGSGTTYEVAVPVTGDGTLSVSVPAGGATDAAGNANTASPSPATAVYDATAPDVTVEKKSGQADPTNASPVLFTVTFDEVVTGFDASDVTASGAGAGTPTVTGSGTTYEVSVPVTSDGTVTVTVDAGKATDAAGNANTASTSDDNAVAYDTARPSVSVARASGTGPTNDSPVEFTVSFNEGVTGFAADDVTAGGDAADGNVVVTATSTSVYSVKVDADGDGEVTLAVKADGAQDSAGNKNTASPAAASIPFDNVDPTFDSVAAANGSPLVTATFSEKLLCSSVSGTDFTAAFGTTPKVVSSVECTGTEDDTVVLTLAESPTAGTNVSVTLAGLVEDAAGNTAPFPTTKNDTTNALPTVAITADPGAATKDTTPTYSGTASDSDGTISAVLAKVDGGSFAATGVTCTGCGTSGSPTWTFTPAQELEAGAHTVAFKAVDNDGEESSAASHNVTVDLGAPSVTVAQKGDQADPTKDATATFTVTFSEDVTGFDAADVALSGAAHGTPAVSGTGSAYEVDVTLTEDGTVTASIPAGGATDTAGNANTASPDTGDRSVTYDGTVPTFDSVTAANGSTAVVPVFSEALDCATVTTDDFAVTINGIFTSVSEASCVEGVVTLTIGSAPTAGQTVRVTLIGDVADLAGNEAASPVSKTVVTNRLPSLSITGGPADDALTNDDTPTYSGTATDPDNDVKQVEVQIGSGAFTTEGVTCTNCETSSATWTWTPTTPLPSGSYDFTFRAVDELDEVSATINRDLDIDAGRPGVTVEQSSAGDPTNVSPVTFTVTFSEEVNGFAVDDLDFTGTTATIGTPIIDAAGAPVYEIDVPVTGDGNVVLGIPADKATDDAGNGNTASTSLDNLVAYDATAPVFEALSAPAGDPDVTALFSEVLECDSVSDDDFAAAVAGDPAAVTAVECGSNRVILTLSITPQATDQVVVSLTGTVTDRAGNAAATTQRTSGASVAPTLAVDNTSPADNSTTNDATPTYTGTAVDPDGLVRRVEVAVGNGAWSTAGMTCTACNSASATWSYTPTAALADGVYAFHFRAVDDANVPSTPVDRTLTVESVRPGATVTGPARTNATKPTFTVTFTEPVSGFDAGDVTLGGTAFQVEPLKKATVAGSGPTYTVEVEGMTREGTITLSVSDGAATDTAGNTSTASNTFESTRDVTAPSTTVTQKGGQADPTNASPVRFVVTFGESVSGFDATDVTVAGNSATPTVTGTGTTYDVTVPVATTGTVTLSVDANKATDAAGNGNAASSGGDGSVDFDNTPPGVSVAADTPNPTSGSTAEFTVTFTEAMTGFAADDLTLGGNATRGTPTVSSTDNTVFDVSVPVTVDGNVTLTIGAAVATDAAGNNNTADPATTPAQATVERSAPTVTITGPARTNASPVTFTVTFSEPVTGFSDDDANDVTVSGTAFNATSIDDEDTITPVNATTYTVDVTGMDKDGTIVVSVPAGAATDGPGNGNVAGTFTATRDTDGPAVSVQQAGDQADPTNGSSVKFAIAFVEKVTGLTVADLDTTGSTATLGTPTLTGSDDTYTVTIPVSGQGDVKLALAAGAAVDEAGNGSDASTSTDNTVTRDSVGPATTVAPVDATENGSSARFTVTFAEDVTDFDDVPGDLTLTGNATRGTPTITQGADAKTYDVAVPVTSDGTVILEVPAGAAVDGAGNGNVAGAAQTVTVDRDVPTPTITGAARTNASPVVFTVTFDEPVSGFTKEDVTVTGTAFSELALMKDHSVTGDDDTYTVSVTGMNQDGTVVVSVAAGAAEDGSGNASSAAGPFTTVRDTTAPTVTVDQATGQADPTNVASAEFKVVFTEKAVGFVVGDIQTSGPAGTPTLTPVGTDGTEFKVVVPITGDGAVTATVPAGAATDEAGNANAASTGDNSVTYDGTRPDFTTVGGQVGRTTVTANFSEAVVCTSAKFAASFNKTVNGTTTTRPQSVTSVACSGSVATLTLSGSPTEGERVAVTLVSGVADAVGNTAAGETVVSPTLSGGATPVTETNPLPTYTGSATGGLPGVNVAKVEVKVDSGTPSDADVTCTGCGTPSATWSWQPDLPMLPGNRTITFIVTNAGGSTMEIVRNVTVL